MNIGDQIRAAREWHYLTVQELANKAKVSASYIYAIEAGMRGSHIDKLYRICKQLELKLDDICYRAFDVDNI